MVTLLHLTSYGAAAVAFVFVTLSLASGLLWLAELIEEHSRLAKTAGKRTVYAVIVFHVLLYIIDPDLPLKLIFFSIACHLVYLVNFRNFPIISLTSWSFISSCILVVADHFLWFFYFQELNEAARRRERRWRHPMEPVPHLPTFLDIATFFGICVWLVPLFLFLSLTANENALPTTRQDPSAVMSRVVNGVQSSPNKPQRQSLFVNLSSKVISLIPAWLVLGRHTRRHSDGIIAPRSVSRPASPVQFGGLLSPTFQPRSPSPSTLMPPPSPLHSPLGSPTSASFGTGSWVPIDGHPPSRPTTPGTPGSFRDEISGARRRVHLQAPPPRRLSDHTA